MVKLEIKRKNNMRYILTFETFNRTLIKDFPLNESMDYSALLQHEKVAIFDEDKQTIIYKNAIEFVNLIKESTSKFENYEYAKTIFREMHIILIAAIGSKLNTMGVDGMGNMFINVNFLYNQCKMNVNKIFPILYHEVLHIQLSHFSRWKKFMEKTGEVYSSTANIIEDYEVNGVLVVKKVVDENFWEEMNGQYKKELLYERWENYYFKEKTEIDAKNAAQKKLQEEINKQIAKQAAQSIVDEIQRNTNNQKNQEAANKAKESIDKAQQNAENNKNNDAIQDAENAKENVNKLADNAKKNGANSKSVDKQAKDIKDNIDKIANGNSDKDTVEKTKQQIDNLANQEEQKQQQQGGNQDGNQGENETHSAEWSQGYSEIHKRISNVLNTFGKDAALDLISKLRKNLNEAKTDDYDNGRYAALNDIEKSILNSNSQQDGNQQGGNQQGGNQQGGNQQGGNQQGGNQQGGSQQGGSQQGDNDILGNSIGKTSQDIFDKIKDAAERGDTKAIEDLQKELENNIKDNLDNSLTKTPGQRMTNQETKEAEGELTDEQKINKNTSEIDKGIINDANKGEVNMNKDLSNIFKAPTQDVRILVEKNLEKLLDLFLHSRATFAGNLPMKTKDVKTVRWGNKNYLHSDDIRPYKKEKNRGEPQTINFIIDASGSVYSSKDKIASALSNIIVCADIYKYTGFRVYFFDYYGTIEPVEFGTAGVSLAKSDINEFSQQIADYIKNARNIKNKLRNKNFSSGTMSDLAQSSGIIKYLLNNDLSDETDPVFIILGDCEWSNPSALKKSGTKISNILIIGCTDDKDSALAIQDIYGENTFAWQNL